VFWYWWKIAKFGNSNTSWLFVFKAKINQANFFLKQGVFMAKNYTKLSRLAFGIKQFDSCIIEKYADQTCDLS